MYYIIYPLFYLLSLLPWWLLYFISDGLYVLTYYCIGYRKAEVMKNLAIAFPEKTTEERLRIAKDFYHNFINTIIETIKFISVSNNTIEKRFTSNIQIMNDLYNTGQNVQLLCGHFFNWEIINLCIPRLSKFPFVGVYQPLTNKVMNNIILQMRQRNGTILIPANKFKTNFRNYVKDRYSLGLAADQNPPSALKAHWVPFFGRLTPFVVGPEKGAKLNNTIIIFAHFYPVKRGYYHTEFELITVEPRSFEEGQLTKIYAQYVERAIRLKPANYLWSHRRWKFTYNELEHGHLRVQ